MNVTEKLNNYFIRYDLNNIIMAYDRRIIDQHPFPFIAIESNAYQKLKIEMKRDLVFLCVRPHPDHDKPPVIAILIRNILLQDILSIHPSYSIEDLKMAIFEQGNKDSLEIFQKMISAFIDTSQLSLGEMQRMKELQNKLSFLSIKVSVKKNQNDFNLKFLPVYYVLSLSDNKSKIPYKMAIGSSKRSNFHGCSYYGPELSNNDPMEFYNSGLDRFLVNRRMIDICTKIIEESQILSSPLKKDYKRGISFAKAENSNIHNRHFGILMRISGYMGYSLDNHLPSSLGMMDISIKYNRLIYENFIK
jgi:hypothetical protein